MKNLRFISFVFTGCLFFANPVRAQQDTPMVGTILNAVNFDDAAFCKKLEEFKTRGEMDVGKMVDKYTRNDGMAVLCGNKIVEFKKFMFVNQSDMRGGWQDRKAAQWNSIYCEGEWLEAINNGWTIALTLVTQDGNRFWHKASCK